MAKNIEVVKVVDMCDKVFKDLKSQTCCFTGHRSQKLPWGENETDERCEEMKKTLRGEIIK